MMDDNVWVREKDEQVGICQERQVVICRDRQVVICRDRQIADKLAKWRQSAENRQIKSTLFYMSAW